MNGFKPSNELRFVEREMLMREMLINPTLIKTVKILQQKWYEDRHPDINYAEAPSYIWVDVPVEQE